MNLKEKISLKIKWLRTQPESVKTRYIWISALVVFAIVVLLWVGLFRKYERNPVNNSDNSELIKEGERIKKDLESKLKVPNIKLPEKIITSASPEASPIISPLVSPGVLE